MGHDDNLVTKHRSIARVVGEHPDQARTVLFRIYGVVRGQVWLFLLCLIRFPGGKDTCHRRVLCC